MMIAKKSIKFLTILALVFTSFSVFAEGGTTTLQEGEHTTSPKSEHTVLQENEHIIEQDGGRVNTKAEIEAYKKHHLADSHDFNLFSYTNDQNERKHVGVPLPTIVWTSKGLRTFMSSAFHHNDDGHVVVPADGVQLTKIHSKIYELNKGETAVSFDEAHHATNAHKVLDFSITKSVVGMLLVGLLMIFGFRGLAKGYKKGAIPTGFARVLEPLVLYVRDEIARPNIGEKHYRKFMGFLLTVFFFIWVSNLLGLTPLGFNITGQLAVTVCLALFTFFIVQFSANKDYWKHIFWMPGVPVAMKFILAPIEFLGILTKPFSLFVRLFANITAGHSVVMGIAALMIVLKAKFGTAGATGVSVFLTLFLTLIEVLVAFLQAYIFTMLSSLFIGMAVEEHEHH
ncbi:F0F1 ATP synthase subunit A [Tenacibaculum finnmarkense genomovar finnmarkense]|uniref:F0F1 ATP synthase subunit A n=1 Tax=Tenacibaculum finnmarkense TaxID=2781243 RepID=UPI001E305E67|nr:F0F1 ATP synthase subunit A [Tenacibaculum finnmarkense]MCD8417078.1 F0F1 ATP synthase subunit A [Tenacibaculum finnmarkense genomovar finnmarkense]MCG8184529.1 F0F1 ATP synthase subunit A [Tenacibaculum finnmarkense genomovar finnmarkense]MCG8202010.1 F0F1 ATP synthase subunit A [Tenacibaculum finnmarkense genomovar finnmarkense]MCG8208765.1 F0F1 ATP synthase subunit A [Tenacibaculum finnmarkense genomovar finnmarkense]MCG8211496.1 F0F1 ATP synthase subunit A [Tenacibaculum finnmarkense ge